MSARYVRADDPDGPLYYIRVLRPRPRAESWTLIRDDSRTGAGVTSLRIDPEQWRRERLDGVFVPVPADRDA